MQEKKNKTGMWMLTLIIVILLLLGYILYVQVVSPGFEKYVVDKQVEALNVLISQVQQTGFLQLTQVDENGNAVVCQLVKAPVQ